MSEVELIMARFEHGRVAERSLSGQNPDVCIVGDWDYSALQGAVKMLYCNTRTKDETDTFLFNGVKIYKSLMFHRGFVFGCKERIV